MELRFIFSSLPEATQILDISANQFGKKHVELIRILSTLPVRIHTLNMASNELHQKSAFEIAQIVAAIPTHITKVGLNENHLGSKSGVELAQIMAAIPSH